MFSDTHFHFHHLIEDGLDGAEILGQLVERNMFFGLDIGTRCDDLLRRHVQFQETFAKMLPGVRDAASEMIYYSAGIWPDVDEIKNRTESVKKLTDSIETFMDKTHLVAIGECGLDHHWNPSGVDGRCESDFDQSVYEGERELFQMQIELARKMNLPVIVHSRDAFDDTLDCIKNMGYHNGIIHCYSYGKKEAEKFLDLGWYIAFGGGVTYTKKVKMDEMIELLRYVPNDRILMETDSPYLAPVPLRGQINTPVFVEHCYNFVAHARGVLASELSVTVDRNIRTLFNL
ncbi:MAG: TatD family hydrolase [Treponema sp.]|uniref:TatD family hydrolase n=1 Tax=Treponema sp. TaxID=166 RepID=UPI0025D0F4D8|nr:TatD family hydrolase [Treponema sp.]MBR0496507.1 TatD family hydrolase [Treponema sp.]